MQEKGFCNFKSIFSIVKIEKWLEKYQLSIKECVEMLNSTPEKEKITIFPDMPSNLNSNEHHLIHCLMHQIIIQIKKHSYNNDDNDNISIEAQQHYNAAANEDCFLKTKLSIDELDAVNIEVVKKIISNIITDIPKELSDRKYTLQTSGQTSGTENVYTSFHLKIEDLGEQPVDNSIGQHADNNININPVPEHMDNIDLSGNVNNADSLPG